MTRTRLIDCDDTCIENRSDVDSQNSDSVALSVIVDQDLGLIGDSIPPTISPPQVPQLEIKSAFNKVTEYSGPCSQQPSANGSQIYLQHILTEIKQVSIVY